MNSVTASIIIIGNEILSGGTLDTNTQTIALRLAKVGIYIREVRVIGDIRDVIINTVRELSAKYDYVFTTGGMGPTHDDITVEAIADAFNVSYMRNKEVYNFLSKYYAERGEVLSKARERMTFFPESATLLKNDVTLVPGFMVKNLCAMAGTPKVMQTMLESAIPLLKTGDIMHSESMEVMNYESLIADQLDELQKQFTDVEIGSYPFVRDEKHGTCLVLRSFDLKRLQDALMQLRIVLVR